MPYAEISHAHVCTRAFADLSNCKDQNFLHSGLSNNSKRYTFNVSAQRFAPLMQKSLRLQRYYFFLTHARILSSFFQLFRIDVWHRNCRCTCVFRKWLIIIVLLTFVLPLAARRHQSVVPDSLQRIDI